MLKVVDHILNVLKRDQLIRRRLFTERIKHTVYPYLLLIFFSLFGAVDVVAQSYITSEVKDLSCREIFRILEDKHGDLWISCADGVFKYNGTEIIDVNLDAFLNDEMIMLSYDAHDDVFWCSNIQGEIGYIKEMKGVKMNFGAIDEYRNCVFNESYMYISFQNRNPSNKEYFIYRIPKSRLKNAISIDLIQEGKYLVHSENLYYDMYANEEGLFFSHSHSLFFSDHNNQISSNEVRAVELNDAQLMLRDTLFYIFSLDTDNHKGGFWGNSVTILDHKLNCMAEKYLKEPIMLNAVFESKDEMLFTLIPSGLKVLNTQTFEFKEFPSLSQLKINCVLRDSRGTLWIGTNKNGVIKVVEDVKQLKFDLDDDTYIIYVTTIDETLVIAQSNGNITLGKEEQYYQLYEAKSEIKRLKKLDNDQFILFTSMDPSKLFRVNSDSSCDITDLGGGKDSHIVDDTVIICTWDGAYLKTIPTAESNHEKFLRTHIISGERSHAVEKNDEFVMVATTSGLYSAPINNLGEMNKTEYWNDSIAIKEIIVDNYNRFWINSQKKGLYYISNGTIESLSLFPYSVEDAHISHIQYVNNYLWVFVKDKVLAINTEDLEVNFISGQSSLPKKDYISVSYLDSSYVFATKHELIQISENYIEDITFKHSYFFESVEVDNNKVDFTEPINLSIDQRDLVINVSSQNFVNDDKPTYFYKLIESNYLDTIEQSTSENAIVLSQLRHGNYSFQLSNNPFYFDPHEIQEIQFSIRPPYYYTKGFIAAAILTLSSLIALLLNYTNKYLQAQKRRKREQLKSFNQLKLRNIQHSLNPHFLNNILNSIHGFMEFESMEKASIVLDKLALLMREIYSFSKAEYINLHQELNFVRSFVKLENLIKDEDIQLEIDSGNLSDHEMINTNIPSLLIQPVVENSIKYRRRDITLYVKISLSLDQNILNVTIVDNGKGIISNNLKNLKNSSLQLIENRLNIINGNTDGISIENRTAFDFGTKIKYKVLIS